ncbi:MAG TPA: RNA 2',3'-cyclic phosphodiesterase [Nitrososphaerales archaeon]|nr:RNA 2',3'-cyclic phosphodiesterase [Nitrososphaerales archaeon]
MRAFLSYDISDPIFLGRVEHLQRELKATGADLKLVNPKILHFTIRFLGEIEKAEKDQIVKVLQGKVENFELDLAFKGVGAFPDDRRISVIWIGIDPSSATALERKANEINALIRSILILGDQKEERFSPHVTISRVRSGRNKEKLTEFLRQHRYDDFGTTKISVLRLKLSELTPAGPEYSDLHVFEKEKPSA